jgi:hypothetical protein
MQEVGEQTDALIARNRILAELASVTDLETAQSLWRAMSRYHWKARDERLTGERTGQPLPTRAGLLETREEGMG